MNRSKKKPPLFYPPLRGPRENVRSRVLLHPQAPRWLVLNPTAVEIAAALFGGKTVPQAARGLERRHGLARTAALRDVRSCRADLKRHGFLGKDASAPLVRRPRLDNLFLHLTDRCNLDCGHCYKKSGAGAERELPLDLVLRLIGELAAAGGRGLTLSGGEPLLHPGIDEILARADARLRVSLLTNGLLLDRDRARRLAARRASVQISLDGPNAAVHDGIRGPGSFDGAVRAVRLLQEAGIGDRLTIAAVIMNQNHRDLEAMLALAAELGVPRLRFLPVRPEGSSRGRWPRLASELSTGRYLQIFRAASGRKFSFEGRVEFTCGLTGFLFEAGGGTGDGLWCPVGTSLVVDTDGAAYPCVLMMRDAFRLGNVKERSLPQLIGSAPMRAACRALAGRRNTIPRCRTCSWRNLCQSGCMGQALDHHGTLDRTDDFCAFRIEAFAETFDRILRAEDSGSHS